MLTEEIPAKSASASRLSLAIITEPGHANAFGTIHGGVLLRLADECGAILRTAPRRAGQITTAAIDSMTFLGPVFVGERVEIVAEVTYVGRTSIETRIDIYRRAVRTGRAAQGRGRATPCMWPWRRAAAVRALSPRS